MLRAHLHARGAATWGALCPARAAGDVVPGPASKPWGGVWATVDPRLRWPAYTRPGLRQATRAPGETAGPRATSAAAMPSGATPASRRAGTCQEEGTSRSGNPITPRAAKSSRHRAERAQRQPVHRAASPASPGCVWPRVPPRRGLEPRPTRFPG